MINAILVDDEPRGLSTLRELLSRDCPYVNILAECQDENSAKEKIKSLVPQLLFLDISIPAKNGFDLLNDLGDMAFEIIFTAPYINKNYLQAFKYSAVDYLLKPINESMLTDAVDRAIKRIRVTEDIKHGGAFLNDFKRTQISHETKICIPTLKGFQVVNLADVIYCEAESSYTNFYLTNGRHMVASKSIIEYELLLGDTTFCRVHKSFLVNLNHIKEYIRGEGGSITLTNNKNIEVSRRKKDAFLRRMKELFKY